VGLVFKKYVNSRYLLVEWKMIERKKGENHDKVKGKALGQLFVVKERKGSMMAARRRGQQKQE
jgi:hypothetical protein